MNPGVTRLPPRIDPAPARLALWVTRARQVPANGGGLLKLVAKREQGGRGRIAEPGRPPLHSGLQLTGVSGLDATWTGR